MLFKKLFAIIWKYKNHIFEHVSQEKRDSFEKWQRNEIRSLWPSKFDVVYDDGFTNKT